MDRITLAFWSLVLGLCGATAFFVTGILGQQATQQQRDAKLESGDQVQLVKVIDGDTVVVSKEGQSNATVRLLGIKRSNPNTARTRWRSMAERPRMH